MVKRGPGRPRKDGTPAASPRTRGRLRRATAAPARRAKPKEAAPAPKLVDWENRKVQIGDIVKAVIPHPHGPDTAFVGVVVPEPPYFEGDKRLTLGSDDIFVAIGTGMAEMPVRTVAIHRALVAKL